MLSGCVGRAANLSPIDAPIVLNGNPFLGDGRAYTAASRGTYEGLHEMSVVSGGYVTSSQTFHTLQITASEAIGGQSDRAIVGLRYKIRDIYAFAYLANGVELEGNIVEYSPAEAK